MSRFRWALLGLAGLVAFAGLPAHVTLARSLLDDAPVRILLVGDSVTQGSAGDWTWRYRLWQHLRDTGTAVDLVGPRNDVYDFNVPAFGSQAYADPRFDRDHAARWGMTFSGQDVPIQQLVRRYRPDVVVEMLGLNDLVMEHRRPRLVIRSARAFVRDARAADPDVDVVLAELPQTWDTGVQVYDDALGALARSLSTHASRVVTARPLDPFVQRVDTWDPAHPSASGEVKIAAGVSDALAGLGIGRPYPRVLPAVPDVPRTPPSLRVLPGDRQAILVWVRPPGATGEYVWVRDASREEPWSRLPYPVAGSRFVDTGLVNGHTYDFRVQATKGWIIPADVISPVVAVVPVRPSGSSPVGPR